MNKMKNLLLNLLSRYYGMRFSKAWQSSVYAIQTPKCLMFKEKYIATRKRLPLMPCGKHFGNHNGSYRKPWLSTQGAE